MANNKLIEDGTRSVEDFLVGKSAHTLMLLEYFVAEFKKLGTDVILHPAKTMIGVSNSHKRIAWITQFGKSFIHVVFPLKKLYPDNTCFIKMAQVPGDDNQFNHHFRMNLKEDLNDEVLAFMQLAYREEVQ
ncbi:DUF5655 domain-containing protein [Mucilaginibacter polytrichastri]|uniref:Uncharacterized protein n=1 Tax=Mucilaginibacter polytrichastri TaxID=1302689 RepID=A0A1Q5ZYG6_9SPHI|nr:DUF5655 domain-containing protein [Mucilaginibacter polytrichastri]OKS86791.1 hypothetical protein RG47T_2248 [Mucilaginibacter polytrichastri]SFT22687.1 hypothetical protein SAMN04487890_11942 [Mucilaginibacter polytrichastri]